MKSLIFIALTLGCTAAVPLAKSYASDYGYTYNPLASAVTSSQFHAQDEFGQYNYGYSNPLSSKQESKSADGVVRGAYSYIDANGELQQVSYISDILGFRTVATNIPVAPAVDPQHVAAAEPVAYNEGVKAVPIGKVMAEAKQVAPKPQSPVVLTPTVAYTYLPYATQYGYYYNPYQSSQAYTAPVMAEGTPIVHQAPSPAPLPVVDETPVYHHQPVAAPVATAPVAAPIVVPVVPAGVTQTQYHAQDEFGQYNFGFADPNSARTETRTADGVVRGSYNYVDSEGQIQTVHYIADALGFRVAGTNVPVAVHEIPEQVPETAEVEAAKAAHLQRYEELKQEHAQIRAEQPAYVPAAVPAYVPAPVPAAVPASEPVQDAPAVTYNEDVSELSEIYPEEVPAIPLEDLVEEAPEPIQVNYVPNEVPEPEPVAADVAPVQPAEYQPVAPAPVSYTYAPYAPTYKYLLDGSAHSSTPIQLAAGVPVNTQYHAQDEYGQYNYGYSNPLSSKQESKTADGVVRGTYSYVDANGLLQTVNYVSDALGFRAAGTNIPGGEAGQKTTTVIQPQVAYSYLPYAVNYPYWLQ